LISFAVAFTIVNALAIAAAVTIALGAYLRKAIATTPEQTVATAIATAVTEIAGITFTKFKSKI